MGILPDSINIHKILMRPENCEFIVRYSFNYLCFMLYLRTFHLYDSRQHYGWKKPGSAAGETHCHLQVAGGPSDFWPETHSVITGERLQDHSTEGSMLTN